MKSVSSGIVYTHSARALRYTLYGSGTPIVLLNGIMSGSGVWTSLVEHFSSRHRVLVWDYMGQGLSSAPQDVKEIGLATFAEDCALVMSGTGIEKAVCIGYRSGALVMLELYRRYPVRVSGMISMCGFYGHAPGGARRAAQKATLGLLKAAVASSRVWGTPLQKALGMQMRMMGTVPWSRSLVRWPSTTRLLRSLCQNAVKMDPRIAIRSIASVYGRNAGGPPFTLTDIRVPFLALCCARHHTVDSRDLEGLVADVPGGECTVLHGWSHAALMEHPIAVYERISRFLDRHEL